MLSECAVADLQGLYRRALCNTHPRPSPLTPTGRRKAIWTADAVEPKGWGGMKLVRTKTGGVLERGWAHPAGSFRRCCRAGIDHAAAACSKDAMKARTRTIVETRGALPTRSRDTIPGSFTDSRPNALSDSPRSAQNRRTSGRKHSS